MDNTLSRRERKKRETHQRLMEAALQLFRKRGYDGATVGQIAEAADVAKGTFFNYFETKEAILPSLAEWRLQQLVEALSSGQDAPASPVARIKLGLRLVAQDPLFDPLLLRRIFTTLVRQPQKQQNPLPGQVLLTLLIEQVRQAQETGEIRADLDTVYLSGLIRAVFFQQMLTWHCGYQPTPLAEMVNGAVDMLLDGIAGPEWEQVE